VASGGIGGIIATTIFQQKDYPTYRPGIWGSIGFQIGTLVVMSITTFIMKRRNRLRREGLIGPLEGTDGFYYTI